MNVSSLMTVKRPHQHKNMSLLSGEGVCIWLKNNQHSTVLMICLLWNVRISLSGCATVSTHHFRCIFRLLHPKICGTCEQKHYSHLKCIMHNYKCVFIFSVDMFYTREGVAVFLRLWTGTLRSGHAVWGYKRRCLKVPKLPTSWQHLNAHHSAPSAPKDLRQEKVTRSFHFILQFFKILLMISSFLGFF